MSYYEEGHTWEEEENDPLQIFTVFSFKPQYKFSVPPDISKLKPQISFAKFTARRPPPSLQVSLLYAALEDGQGLASHTLL
jgi:hypothetical protein